MSSSRFLRRFKHKKAVDYSKVPLKQMLVDVEALSPKIPAVPAKTFITEKPVINWAPPRASHEVARILLKVARRKDRGYNQTGAYFYPDGSARCIIGALILELPNGKAIRNQIRAAGLNGGSVGSIVTLLPYEFSERQLLHALMMAQSQNDQNVPWEHIARTFATRVGYRTPRVPVKAA
jgi:hypothetical protein